MSRGKSGSAAIRLLTGFSGMQHEAGIDEAGRGCLAGPVYAAAVILPADFYHPLLNDSKQMSEENRMLLREVIEAGALDFGLGSVSAAEIDRINILQATYKAMHLALAKLKQIPDFLLVDGNRFLPWREVPFQCMIEGDARYAHIAAASVLAKTYRDEEMMRMHEQYPVYHWKDNKGYGTARHRQAMLEHGISPFHRRSFQLKDQQLSLFG